MGLYNQNLDANNTNTNFELGYSDPYWDEGTGEPRTVSLPGGDLIIEWDGTGPVYLEGPAVTVFWGEWES